MVLYIRWVNRLVAATTDGVLADGLNGHLRLKNWRDVTIVMHLAWLALPRDSSRMGNAYA